MRNLLSTLGLVFMLSAFFFPINSFAQKAKKKKAKAKTEEVVKEKPNKTELEKLSLAGLKFRSVGPALTSGRIADIAVHPNNPYLYYVATAAGGVWKTVNNGTTFQPIFDSQGSYSIGCVTIDPNNPNRIWVGTGENNNQRSVSYGDGIYRSDDGGKSWKHKGLKMSEHIGKIIVHPDNSNVVYVAAIGPLWNSGGERGVYKTIDGGENWELVLEIDQYTGVNDLIMDSRNPDVLYAAAFQRARHVFTYLGGGPGSGMYKSEDGGKNWNKINAGLPKVDIGRIGLSQSPADPEIIYAIVEAAQRKGGTYWTKNRGASWEKRGDYSTSGNYYQEIIADNTDPMKLYAMDTWMKVSTNGGKSFKNVGEDTKHVDNHSMWIDPANGDHWLVGCDGGIYETYEAGKTWIFKANLPVTQFYKVAVDNAKPFYNIYGGTQDNFSLGGPSRVNNDQGITNADWFITHGGDGFESQVAPDNPNIIYAQSQYGVLVRYDKLSGEEIGIQPKPRKDENAYRWNWDAPLQVSAHKKGRLYFSANKVFKSDDYGNSWEVISDDLSQQIDRNKLKIMDRVWEIDAVMKNGSTSPYGTIVAFCESPLNENLLIAGTDDGLIQITKDGGTNWQKITAPAPAGAPNNSYVNNVYASQHDEQVIYAAYNHHKYGDFKPYLFKSNDQGATWNNISSTLPERGSVYAIEEDHDKKDLIFCGTEFGAFYSPNGGNSWKQLKAGLPTIAVRDIAIQREENDLVLGTFGRGFYVLDDYSVLREITAGGIKEEAKVFASRDALQFEYSTPLGLPGKSFQGDDYYTAENLGSEAIITYYLKEKLTSKKDERLKETKEFIKDKKPVSYPTYEALLDEQETEDPKVVLSITDDAGRVVHQTFMKSKKGLQRYKWNMRYTPQSAISFSKPSFYNPFAGKKEGTLVAPGNYTVALSTLENGELKKHGSTSLKVVPLNNTVMPAKDRFAKVEFQREVAELSKDIEASGKTLGELKSRIKHMRKSIELAENSDPSLLKDAMEIQLDISVIERTLYGDRIKSRLDIEEPPSPRRRIGGLGYEQKYSTAAPTKTHQESLKIAIEEFIPIKASIEKLIQYKFKPLEQKLESINAPYTPGRGLN